MSSSQWPLGDSPFIFEGPLPPAKVVGRDGEIESLRAAAQGGRPVAVYAPRRYGKTSLLLATAERLRKDRMAAVLVDLYGTHSLADLAVRLERGYAQHLTGRVRGMVQRMLSASGLGLSLEVGGFGLRLQREPRTDPLPALHLLLDLPRHLGEQGRRCWVTFDEFQAVLHIPHAEAVIRSHVQHHREFAAYVFAGSQTHLLERIFVDRARPFYGQAEARRLERLRDGELADAIEREFEATERSAGEVLASLLAFAAGHPQRAMLLAHHLWTATPHGQIAGVEEWLTACAAAMEHTRLESEARFEALTVNQQRVLRALAVYGTPFAQDAYAEVGLAEGNVSSVVSQLTLGGDIERLGRGSYRFIDPLFAEWLRERFERR